MISFLYIVFVLGELTHIFKRASMSNLVPGSVAGSLWVYIGKYWNVILIRTVVAFMIFVFWIDHPQSFDALVAKYLNQNIDIAMPETKTVAFFAGFFSDSGLDYLAQKAPLPASIKSWLQREVPALPDHTSGE